jgi:hypothetical protein
MQQHRQSLLTLKVELRMDFWKISLPLIRIFLELSRICGEKYRKTLILLAF